MWAGVDISFGAQVRLSIFSATGLSCAMFEHMSVLYSGMIGSSLLMTLLIDALDLEDAQQLLIGTL